MRPLGRGMRCPLDVEKRWIDGVRCSVLQLMFSFTNEGANHRESETHLLCLLATSLLLAFTFLALLLLPAPLLFGLSCFPLLLLLEPLLTQRQMSKVGGICQPELNRSLEEDVTDSVDHWCFLSLADVHDLKQAPVELAQVKNVVEHLVDEVIDLAWTDDGWPCAAKGTDEELNGS